MNHIVKYGLSVFVIIVISVIFLKPILTHENEYRVVIVNISERPVSSVIISGAGANTTQIGPLSVGNMQDYYFVPTQNAELTYTINQDKQSFSGIINNDLKKGDVGEIYVVIGEMHQVKIYDDYDTAY
ncbi:MAG: hypothetical protein OEX07_00575 [Gammaproteobacteria bacterium]|nr:hypothetical protein [Gammaproteobacteria bacterium]